MVLALLAVGSRPLARPRPDPGGRALTLRVKIIDLHCYRTCGLTLEVRGHPVAKGNRGAVLKADLISAVPRSTFVIHRVDENGMAFALFKDPDFRTMGSGWARVEIPGQMTGRGPVRSRVLAALSSRPHGDEIAPALDRAIVAVEKFFGEPFRRPFTVHVFTDRKALDAYWRRLWRQPDFRSECWMVASGQDGVLSILAPSAWKAHACDHNPKDRVHVQNLVAHEVVHVYHDHRNPHTAFEGDDAIGWLVEGLAVYASGQLEEKRLLSASEAIRRGRAPARLAAAWTGKYRYGVCGSLVRFVDHKVGRKRLVRLLGATTPRELHAAVGMDETELLAAWRRWVRRTAAKP